MNKINFAIAIHFHQPIGNFEKIFDRAYNFCYKVFLELLYEYPDLLAMFHISGCLLDYMEAKHPDSIKLIKKMISRRQVEIMGGGYYEPILTAVGEKDLRGQIKEMAEHIKRTFGIAPKGMWVAERVWHPDLAKILYKAGIRYIILDDEHLARSGVEKEDIYGYFLTGKGKERIAVFPSDKNLRYMIPFKTLDDITGYFKGVSERKGNVLLTYGDDGEKFGEWPETYKHVYENQWLKNFFEMLEDNKDWIKLVHFSDYLKKHKPTRSLTIKQGSYEEMMEWSGGSWINFLKKYPEANQMHKKMIYVSLKIEKAEKKKDKTKLIESARRHLYKGQCNCGYWHGVFGGLYLYHLRQAIYSHLIEADKIIDKVLKDKKKEDLSIESIDYDKDGNEEVIIENGDFSLYVDPHEGGVIKELDYKALSLNLLNAISRKKESYHEKILAAPGDSQEKGAATIHDDFRKIDPMLKEELFYDKFSRFSFRSYFVKDDSALSDFVSSSYVEAGDFSNGDYKVEKKEKGVILARESNISSELIKLHKEIEVKSKDKIEFILHVEKKGAHKTKALLLVEFNITMPYLNSDRYGYFSDDVKQIDINTKGVIYPNSSFGILDNTGELSVGFYFSKKPDSVLYFPVMTVSQSERAYELNYQCSCISFLFDPNIKKSIEIEMRFITRKT